MSPRREEFIVKRGARVRLLLPKESAAAEEARAAARAGEESKMLQPSDADDELYAFRRRGVKLFDLGYQLTDADAKSYEEIAMKHARLSTEFDTDDWRIAFMNEAQAAMLAGEPFEKTHGVENRRALKFASELLYVDVVVTKEGEERRSVIGKKNTRPTIVDLLAGGGPMATDKDDWQSGATLKPIKEADAIRVESNASYFHSFDTANLSLYKITAEPSYDADEIALELSDVRAIYLVPAVLVYQVQYKTKEYEGGCESPSDAAIYFDAGELWDRLPVENPPLNIFFHDGSYDGDAAAQNFLKSRMEIYGATSITENFNDHLALNNSIIPPECRPMTPILPSFDGLFALLSGLGFAVGFLAGVIVTQAKKFFVWQRDTPGLAPYIVASAPYDRNGIVPIA
jgi:hypothetical protein